MQFYDQYIDEAETIVRKIMKTRWSMFINLTDTNKKAFVRRNFQFSTITINSFKLK